MKPPFNPEINRLPREPVLFCENDPELTARLKAVATEAGMECEAVENPSALFERLKSESFSIIITELEFAGDDYNEYLKKLQTESPSSLLIVLTSIDDSQVIINSMKLGVFDFIIKPLDNDFLRHRFEQALEYKFLRNLEEEYRENVDLKLKNQLGWLNYKEVRRKVDQERHTIYNLRTSLAQGGGIGSSISLVEMLEQTKSETAEGYLMDRDICDLLFENNAISRRMVTALNSITELMDEEFVLEKCRASELVGRLPEFIHEVKPFLETKKYSIKYPDSVEHDCELMVDQKKVAMAVKELFINACKYSVPGTNIDIFTHRDKGYFWLAIRNQIPDSEKGVPPRYEKMVLEPFFRERVETEDEIAEIEQYGMGLGLTMVDYVVRQHDGLFFIQNSKKSPEEAGGYYLLSGIFFPASCT